VGIKGNANTDRERASQKKQKKIYI